MYIKSGGIYATIVAETDLIQTDKKNENSMRESYDITRTHAYSITRSSYLQWLL
jgi:hypothetical protein